MFCLVQVLQLNWMPGGSHRRRCRSAPGNFCKYNQFYNSIIDEGKTTQFSTITELNRRDIVKYHSIISCLSCNRASIVIHIPFLYQTMFNLCTFSNKITSIAHPSSQLQLGTRPLLPRLPYVQAGGVEDAAEPRRIFITTPVLSPLPLPA